MLARLAETRAAHVMLIMGCDSYTRYLAQIAMAREEAGELLKIRDPDPAPNALALLLCSYICGVILLLDRPVRVGRS
jgi:hypothetical protein